MEHLERIDRNLVEEHDRNVVEELDREVVDVLPAREELLLNNQQNNFSQQAGLVNIGNLGIL